MKKLCAVALLILLPATAFAADPDTPAPDPKEKKICRTESVTGSRLKRNRICMTSEEWRVQAQATKESVEAYSRTTSRAGVQSGPFGP